MTDLCFVADIYHGNPIDFTKLAAASWNGIKCVGIIHKASQGAGIPDPEYPLRRPVAIAAGFLWGAYAFNTGEPVANQVAEFFKVAIPDTTSGMYLDFEDNTASEMSLSEAIEFLDRGDQKLGRRLGIYSGNRMKELIPAASSAERDFLASHAFWGCEYGPEFKDVDAKGRALPWTAPFLWQDTGDGIGPQPHTLAGLEQGADLSIFKGTRDELAAKWPGAALVTV
jgi:GH25 family lysozyme M1 (1,4-beta-N-acetylmuramidase)